VLANYCWGYVSRREEFLAWAGQVQATSRLVNPLDVLAWNTTKTYRSGPLIRGRDLWTGIRSGISVTVPTHRRPTGSSPGDAAGTASDA
jgi:hypothetical protein